MKNRILVIDDNRHIYEDFAKILDPKADGSSQIDELEELVFGDASRNQSLAGELNLQLDYAAQGEEGVERAKSAHADGQPYFMAFVDVRMPPGMDGVQTIKALWRDFADLPCVICTAHTDYEWHQLVEQLGRSSQLLVLRKPFDPIEVRQIVLALYEQVRLSRMSNRLLESMSERAQSAQFGQLEQVEKLADELRSPLVSVLSYGERLLATDFNQDTCQREVNRICAHTRFLIDLVDQFSYDSQDTAVKRSRSSVDHILTAVQMATVPALDAKERKLSVRIARSVKESVDLPKAELQSLLTNLVEHVAAASDGVGPMQLGVDYLPIVVNSTLQFTLIDNARTAATESLGWHELVEQAREIGCTLTTLSGDSTSYVVSVTVTFETKNESSTSRIETTDESFDLSGKRVLLAEDSPELQRMLCGILSGSGAHVTSVENGIVALARFMQARDESEEFDLALLDLQMPMMDGCTVARRMQSIGSDMPTFVLVNDPSDDVRQRCKLAGCSDVIAKPVERSALLQALQKHCVA